MCIVTSNLLTLKKNALLQVLILRVGHTLTKGYAR